MKLTLQSWASRHFEKPPSLWTLRRLVREGKITPPPVLVGREYQVEETARLVGDTAPQPTLVQRMQGARA